MKLLGEKINEPITQITEGVEQVLGFASEPLVDTMAKILEFNSADVIAELPQDTIDGFVIAGSKLVRWKNTCQELSNVIGKPSLLSHWCFLCDRMSCYAVRVQAHVKFMSSNKFADINLEEMHEKSRELVLQTDSVIRGDSIALEKGEHRLRDGLNQELQWVRADLEEVWEEQLETYTSNTLAKIHIPVDHVHKFWPGATSQVDTLKISAQKLGTNLKRTWLMAQILWKLAWVRHLSASNDTEERQSAYAKFRVTCLEKNLIDVVAHEDLLIFDDCLGKSLYMFLKVVNKFDETRRAWCNDPSISQEFWYAQAISIGDQIGQVVFQVKFEFWGGCFRNILSVKIILAGFIPGDYVTRSVEHLDVPRIVSWAQHEDIVKFANCIKRLETYSNACGKHIDLTDAVATNEMAKTALERKPLTDGESCLSIAQVCNAVHVNSHQLGAGKKDIMKQVKARCTRAKILDSIPTLLVFKLNQL